MDWAYYYQLQFWGIGFSVRAVCVRPSVFPFLNEQPEWDGPSVVWVFSIRLRNPRCPFGSTSVSAPRRDGLDEVIICASVLHNSTVTPQIWIKITAEGKKKGKRNRATSVGLCAGWATPRLTEGFAFPPRGSFFQLQQGVVPEQWVDGRGADFLLNQKRQELLKEAAKPCLNGMSWVGKTDMKCSSKSTC